MSIILRNTTYIDWKTLLFKNTNIVVEQGLDKGVFFFDDYNNIEISDVDEVIDCAGKLVTKSFAIGHHHAYSALARGIPPPKHTPSNFHEILKYIWWNLDKALDANMIEASAFATAIACAKAGSTFVIDHHASPNFIKGSLEIIAHTFDKVGVSHLLCYEVTDRDGLDKAQLGLEETDNYLSKNQGLVGLHASFTVGNSTLKQAVELMQKHESGIHIHVAEDSYDQQQCMQNYNGRVVERLNDFGVLDSPKTILAHCLHIDDNERLLLGNSPAYVVQNTESNLNNAVGYFNSANLGDNIFLGTDGMHSDMIRSAQSAFFVGQANDSIDFLTAYYRFRKVHNYISNNDFAGDGENNLVIFDYDSPTDVNDENFLGHFIYGLTSNHIQHVISNGKLIVKDKLIQTVDEKEIIKFTKEQAVRLWGKL